MTLLQGLNSEAKTPTIVVTNYQQYIHFGFLADAIANNIDPDMGAVLPDNLYVSIAYLDIKKARARGEKPVYITNLVLSIKGVSHAYKLIHNNTDLYLAKKGLDLNQYADHITKDMHIRLLQHAFEGVVFMRASSITNDIITNNLNMQ